MLPGPTAVVECADCGKFLINQSVLGPGGLAFQRFTDGLVEIGAGFDQPGYCICPLCGYLEDFHRLREVGTKGEAWTWWERLRCAFSSRTGRYHKLRYFWKLDCPVVPKVATATDFLATLSKPCPDRELHLRIGLWQTWNQSQDKSQDDPEFQQNLKGLLSLCDPDLAQDRLVMAEAYRHLGRFAEGLQVLKPPLPEAELLRARAVLALLRVRERSLKRIEGNMFTPQLPETQLPWDEVPYELYADRFP